MFSRSPSTSVFLSPEFLHKIDTHLICLCQLSKKRESERHIHQRNGFIYIRKNVDICNYEKKLDLSLDLSMIGRDISRAREISYLKICECFMWNSVDDHNFKSEKNSDVRIFF